jgi:hypothetical protein
MSDFEMRQHRDGAALPPVTAAQNVERAVQ